jgi:hypothetical protein
MKTLYEYEPSDIKMKDFADGEQMDPVHTFLFGQIMVMILTGIKPLPTDPSGDPMFPVQRLIADFLNSAQKAGITVAKGESVPAVFREASA